MDFVTADHASTQECKLSLGDQTRRAVNHHPFLLESSSFTVGNSCTCHSLITATDGKQAKLINFEGYMKFNATKPGKI